MGATDIARAVGCKRGNVYKTLKAAGVAEAKLEVRDIDLKQIQGNRS